MALNYDIGVVTARVVEILFGPDDPPYLRQDIGKGRFGFEVPRTALGHDRRALAEVMGDQADERKQAQQGRRGTRNGQVRPLALGLDAEMSAGLFESDFHMRAPRQPCWACFRSFA